MVTMRSGSMGPVDYLVVLFPGNKFTGEIAPELVAMARSGIIRVIDLVVVTKDGDGVVGTSDVEDINGEMGEALRALSQDLRGWLAQEDIDDIGAMMPMGSMVAALLLENTWNERLRDVILEASTIILTEGSIPRKLVMQTRR